QAATQMPTSLQCAWRDKKSLMSSANRILGLEITFSGSPFPQRRAWMRRIPLTTARDVSHDHQRALCLAMLQGLRHSAVHPIRHPPQCGRIALLRAGKQCSGKLIELLRVTICEAKRPDQGTSEWLVPIGRTEWSSHI